MEIIKKFSLIATCLLVCGCQSSTPLNIDNVNPLVIEKLDTLQPSKNKASGNFSDNYQVVAHAFGAIDGYELTNSLEAFMANYEKGTRVFEIDMELSEDGDVVLTHGWPWFNDTLVGNNLEYTALSTKVFQDSKIYGKYQPLTFDDALYILQRYPDVYFIIDSKTFDLDGFKKRYELISEKVKAIDSSLLQRIIPQAYNFEMALWLKNESDFKEYILTCYAIYDQSSGLEIFEFVKENNVPIVTMHMANDWAKKVITDIYAYATYQEYQDKFKIYIHTVNDINVAKDIIKEYHFNGIYSDDISETEFKEALN